MRFHLLPITAIAFVMAVPATGQSMKIVSVTAIGPTMAVGMQVTDPNGGPVGTVAAMQADSLTVKTDKHDVTLPKSSFTPTNGKLVFSMTQAQLDAQIEQSLAATNAAIVAGAAVKSSDGTQVGKVDSVADGQVVLALDSGARVAVPQAGARGNADGTVTVGYTAAQLAALGGGAH